MWGHHLGTVGSSSFPLRSTFETQKHLPQLLKNNNHRCIDINSLIGVGSTNNILELIQEFVRIEKMDALFDKKKVTDADIKALDDEITEIELTRGLVEKIKESIK